jgi:hypothetical protein
MVERWVERYLRAWNSNDPQEIGALFAEEAEYYTAPYREPWRGRAEIVRRWLGRRDEPGTFHFRYEVLGTSALPDTLGGRGFVRGWTEYFEPQRSYHNLWVVTLDVEGRCLEFTEWFMQEKRS